MTSTSSSLLSSTTSLESSGGDACFDDAVGRRHHRCLTSNARETSRFEDLILSPRKLLDKLLIVCPNVDTCQEILPRRDLQVHLLYRCKGGGSVDHVTSCNRFNRQTTSSSFSSSFSSSSSSKRPSDPLLLLPSAAEDDGGFDSPSSATATSVYDGSSQLFLTSRPLQVPEEQITRLFINRSGQPLGVTVVGGIDTPLVNVIIQEVYRKGIVYKDGRLKPGDQLVEVNGVDLTRVTHLQAVQALSKSCLVCEVVVFREPFDQGLSKLQRQEILTVKLRKFPGKQLGIKLIQKKKLPGLHILEIIDDSIAYCDDRLRPDDQILLINGKDMRRGTQEEAVDVIQSSRADVEFVVSRTVIGRMTSFGDECVHVTSEKNGFTSHDIDYCTPRISWDKVISVNKRENDSLGISIAGGRFDGGYDTPIYVTNMQTDGCIAKTGQILKGDVLVDINGRSLLNLSHNEAAQVLTSLSKSRRLVLHVVQGTETSEGSDNFRPSWRFWLSLPASCHSVKAAVIERSAQGSLGFSIVGGYISRCGVVPVFVKSVVHNGPAGRDDKLRSGDMIVSVNGISLDGATHSEAVQLLTSDSSHVILTVVSWPGSLV